MALQSLFRKKKFIITGELTPPRKPDISSFCKDAKNMAADAINITDMPGARFAMSSLAGSILVKQQKKEPIYQLTCRDRNSLALEGDLIAAAAFGITDVLALTGDPPHIGDRPKAKAVYEFNSVGLVKLMARVNREKKADFFIGCGLSHHFPNLSPEIEKTKQKLAAGCEFFQTQPIFEASQIERFVDAYEKQNESIRRKILAGVLTLHSRELVSILRTLPGIVIPTAIEKRISSSKDLREESQLLAIELSDAAKEMGFAGVHLLTMGDHSLFNEIAGQIR